MLKKFESLGTVLSRDEAKKIVGGEGEQEFGCATLGTICCSNADCGTDTTCTCFRAEGVENAYCVTKWWD